MSDLIERLLNPRSFDHEALRKEAVAHIRELEDELWAAYHYAGEEVDRLRAENAELRHRLIHTLTCELEEHEIAEYRNYLDKTANETEGK
jgi:hypothetical protein